MINLVRFGILSVLVVFSINEISANEKLSRLDECALQVKRQYKKMAQPSDVSRGFDKSEILLAGKPLLGFHDQTLAIYEEDKLIYTGNGSYHSGYFTDLIVANIDDCQIEEIINTYSE